MDKCLLPGRIGLILEQLLHYPQKIMRSEWEQIVMVFLFLEVMFLKILIPKERITPRFRIF